MYKVSLPCTATIGLEAYDVVIDHFCDETLRRLNLGSGEYYNKQFTTLNAQNLDLDGAIRWVQRQLPNNFNPFVFNNTLYTDRQNYSPTAHAQIFLDKFKIDYHILPATSNLRLTFPNGRSFTGVTTTSHLHNLGVYNNYFTFSDAGTHVGCTYETFYLPNDIFRSGRVTSSPDDGYRLTINFDFEKGLLPGTLGRCLSIYLQVLRGVQFKSDSTIFFTAANLIGVDTELLNTTLIGGDSSNPYEITPSTPGGGGGSYYLDGDIIDDPEVPDIDAITTGLITVFAPTLSQVNALGNYLWSDLFDLDTLKKLFSDPMQAIIGLSIVPIKPNLAGSKSVKIGDVDTGITMSYIGRQFVEKDMGSVTIDPYIGSFMDYAPYTKVSIYLPYIGFRDLSPDDVMDCTISVKYIIDVLTGGCNAVVSVSGKGALYQFNGSCIANVPLSAINYSGAIQNAVSAIGSGITAVAGFATGAVPVGAMGVAGLVSNAANTAMNSKPTIQRSGSMGGAAGLASVQFPYVVIERPNVSMPARFNDHIGNMLNVTLSLGSCSGFTMVDKIHLDDLYCTEDERAELERLLKEGVIL